MAKLSAQLKDVSSIRTTRTERQLSKEKILQDQKQFEELKTKAEDLQQNKLSNIQSIEQYKEVYNEIDPELQQFFSTPSELQTSQDAKLGTSKATIQSQIEENLQRQSNLDKAFAQSKSEIPKLDPNERSSFRKDITNEYNRNTATVQGKLSGLREGLTMLDQGQDISVSEINKFARRKGAFQEERERDYIKGRETRLSTPIISKEISENYIMNKLKGLTSEGKKTVRNVTGGKSDVEILSVKGGEKIQVIREQDTGKVYIKDIEGKNKGEFIYAQGLSDPEINKQQQDFDKKQNKKAEEFLKEQGLNQKVISKDVVVNKSLFKKSLDIFKTGWVTVFPYSDVKLPEEYYEGKEVQPPILSRTILNPINNILINPFSAIPIEKDMEKIYSSLNLKTQQNLEAEYQIELVEKFNIAVEKAPEDLKYYVQEKGFDLLSERGSLGKGKGYDPEKKIVISNLGEEVNISSKAIDSTTKLRTYSEYIMEKDYNAVKQEKENRLLILNELGLSGETDVKKLFKINEQSIIPKKQSVFNYGSPDITWIEKSIKKQQAEITPASKTQAIHQLTIATGKSVEFYAIGKLIGVGLGGIGYGSKFVKEVLSGGLGKGVKLTDATFRAGQLSATASYTSPTTPILQRLAQWESSIGIKSGSSDPIFKTLAKIQKAITSDTSKNILRYTSKGTLYTGVGGLYTYSKIKRYNYLTGRYEDDLAKSIFKTELTGELIGLGALSGEAFYKNVQQKKLIELNKKIDKINVLKLQKAQELKLIKQEMDLGISGGKKLSYKEIGVAEKVLSKTQQKELAKVYSRINLVPEKEAIKIIKQQSIYEQSYLTKSNIPAINKEIGRLQGKKVIESVDDFLTFKKYGFSETINVNEKVKSVAFEWTVNKGRVANLGYKVSFGKDKNVLTGIYEQARYSPKLDMRGFRLKKLITTKALNVKKGTIGDVKIETFDIDNRLLKSVSGKKFLSQTRISGLDLYKSTPTISSTGELKITKNYLDDIAKLYKGTGRESTTSYFSNVRVEFPTYENYGILKIMNKDKSFFFQAGKGTPFISTKIGRVKSVLANSNYYEVLEKLKTSPVNPVTKKSDNTVNVADDVVKEIKKILKDSKPSYVGGSGSERGLVSDKIFVDRFSGKDFVSGGGGINPQTIVDSTIRSIQSPIVNVKVRLKNLINIKTLYGDLTVGGSALKSGLQTDLKTKQLTKIDLKSKQVLDYGFGNVLKQNTRIDQMIKQLTSQKQSSQQVQKFQSISGGSSTFFSPTGTARIIPEQPRIPQSSIPIIPIWFPNAKSKLKKKVRDKLLMQELAFLPDFTSRSIGLEPNVLTQAQARKQMKKLQTGLEIRKGVIIKPNKLLRGIPN